MMKVAADVFLSELLAGRGWVELDEILTVMRERGWGERTARRAKFAIGAEHRGEGRPGEPDRYWWRLSPVVEEPRLPPPPRPDPEGSLGARCVICGIPGTPGTRCSAPIRGLGTGRCPGVAQ